MGFFGGSVVKNLSANEGDMDSIPELGRSSGEGNDYSLQYSCLENFTEELGRLYSPWGHKESDKTEYVYTRQLLTA